MVLLLQIYHVGSYKKEILVLQNLRGFQDDILTNRQRDKLSVAEAGSRLIVCAGVPFGTPGSTNLLHIVRLTGDELKRR